MTLEESVKILFDGAESAWQTALILAKSQFGELWRSKFLKERKKYHE